MFSKKYKIGEWNNIPFNVTMLWIGVVGLFTYNFSFGGGIERYVTTVTEAELIDITTPVFTSDIHLLIFSFLFILSVYASVLLHELGHVYGAQKHDIPVASITLWILGGAAEITRQPETPRSEFEVTIAGPLVSLLLGIIFLTTAGVTTMLGNTMLTLFCLLLGALNVLMLVLNLIPAFPLDGGRLLRSALNYAFGFEKATKYTTGIGFLLGAGAIIGGVLTLNLFGVLIGAFVSISSRKEHKRVKETRDLLVPVQQLQEEDSNFFDNAVFLLTGHPEEYSMKDIENTVTRQNGEIVTRYTDHDDIDYIVVDVNHREAYKSLAKQNPGMKLLPTDLFLDHVKKHNTQLQTPRNKPV